MLRAGVGESPDGDWAAVFAYARYPDGSVRKITIFTAEADYAQRLAGVSGGRLPLPLATVQQRFPAIHPGWVIDNGDVPPAGDAPASDAPASDAGGMRSPLAVPRRVRVRHRIRRRLSRRPGPAA